MLMSDTPRIEMSHETREKLRRDNVDLLGVIKKAKPDTKAFREILDEEIKKEPHSRQTKRVLVRYLEINLFSLYQKVRNKQDVPGV